MVFRDYVQLLYKAYLEDQGVISKLRDKVKDSSYLQDLDDDPGFDNWQSAARRKIRFHPSKINPQEGTAVYEARSRALSNLIEVIDRRNKKYDRFKNQRPTG